MKKIFTLSIIFNLIFTMGLLNGQGFSKVGTSAAQFLKIPVGARAISMGSSFASIADDATSMYWNPSGIANVNSFEIYASHSQWIAEIDHNYFGLVVPIDEQSSVGINAITLSSGDIERTTISNPRGTGTFFDATDISVGVSYARYLIEDISVGLNVKYVNQRIWNTSAETFAVDFGILLHTGYYGMTLGLSFQNFGPEMQMSGSDLIRTFDQDLESVSNPLVETELQTEKYSLPVSYRASIAMPLVGINAPFQIPNSDIVLAVDAIHLNENFENYSAGLEYGFHNTFFVRSGYRLNTDEEGLTFGAGLNLSAFNYSAKFDYAYSEFGLFDAVHTFSVGLKL